jgi:hypothetical protein
MNQRKTGHILVEIVFDQTAFFSNKRFSDSKFIIQQ